MQILVKCEKCQEEFKMQRKPEPYVTVCPVCGKTVWVKPITILVLAGTHQQFKQHQREHPAEALNMVYAVRPEHAEAFEREATRYKIVGTFWFDNPCSIEIYNVVERRGYESWSC